MKQSVLPTGAILATNLFGIVRAQVYMRPSVLRLLSHVIPASTTHADHWYTESPVI